MKHGACKMDLKDLLRYALEEPEESQTWRLILQHEDVQRVLNYKTNGADLIRRERQRQIWEEDYGDLHDDDVNTQGELAWAAVCYAAPSKVMREINEPSGVHPGIFYPKSRDPWPWLPHWDKRKKHDRIRQLTIAGALCASEIDRLKRLENKGS